MNHFRDRFCGCGRYICRHVVAALSALPRCAFG
ncbi:SWIM zinc finger family protein [Phaeobacter gallaeciensis]